MSKDVQIEGINDILSFPDNTPDSVIDATVKRIVAEKSASAPQDDSLLAKLAPSIKRTGEIYMQDTKEGMDKINKAVEDPTGKNILQGFLGALQYGMAPINAPTKAIVGEPIGSIPRSLGAPEWLSKFVQDLAEGATGFIPYAGLVKQASNTLRNVSSAQQAQNLLKAETKAAIAAGSKGVKKALEMPPNAEADAVLDATTPISQTSKKVLTNEVIDDTIEASKDVVGKVWDPKGEKRLTQELVDYIMQNKDEIPKVLTKYNLTPDELAAQIKETMTISGRNLYQMSVWAKQVQKDLQSSPVLQQLAATMEQLAPEGTRLDKFMEGWRKVENVRRSMLVSQVATTMRNITSQGARLTLGAVDDAFQGAIKGFMGSAGESAGTVATDTFKGIGDGLDSLVSMWHQMTPTGRKALSNILDTDNALNAKALMYGSPVGDVTLGDQVSKVTNFLNTTQEYFFRNIAFEAKLHQMLKSAGIKDGIKGVASTDIPEEMMKKAAEYALEMTFQSSAKSEFGKTMLKALSSPVGTTFVTPFPRFLWANAIPFLKEFSPIGFLEAFSPSTIAELASGNADKFVKAASRATLGSMMMSAAYQIRSNPEYAGEKYNEINVDGKTVDVQSQAPFSTYLFLAEAIKNPEKIKPGDWGAALISLNRIGGTGLVLADILRGKSADTVKNIVKRFAGEYVGGFTTPVRTVKDIYSHFDPEEAVIRDSRDSEFIAPTQRNIPVWSQELPKAVSPLSVEDKEVAYPLTRQLTGISLKEKNIVEAEVDRLGLDPSAYSPRSGSPEADRLISEAMAPQVATTITKIIESPGYQQMNDAWKKLMLQKAFEQIKDSGRKEAMNARPDLKMQIKLDKLPEPIKDILKDRGVKIK